MSRPLLFLGLLALGLSSPALALAQTTYSVLPLTPGHLPLALSRESGEIVVLLVHNDRAHLYNATTNTLTLLDTRPSGTSKPRAAHGGQIVGELTTSSGAIRAFRVEVATNAMTILGVIPGSSTFSRLYAVNNAGEGAGTSDNGPFKAIRVVGTTLTVLPSLSERTNAQAFAMNDAGQITGISATERGASRCALWEADNTYVNCHAVNGFFSIGYAITPGGDIAGIGEHDTLQRVFVRAAAGGLTLQPFLPGTNYQLMGRGGMNDHGTIVGTSTVPPVGGVGQLPRIATLWKDGNAIDLNGQISAADQLEWDLQDGVAITNADVILVKGIRNGVEHQYALLIPDPAMTRKDRHLQDRPTRRPHGLRR